MFIVPNEANKQSSPYKEYVCICILFLLEKSESKDKWSFIFIIHLEVYKNEINQSEYPQT